MFDIVKENVWDAVEPYYNTGEGNVFVFDGAEGGEFYITTPDGMSMCASIGWTHFDEFVNFVNFVKQHVKEWQESPEGIKRLKEIKDGTGYHGE